MLQWILAAGRFPQDPDVLAGGVLLVETSEKLIPPSEVGWILRSMGERGILSAVDAVLVARPPTSNFDDLPDAAERARRRDAQCEAVIETVARYNSTAVVCVGIPFGHTRPQWILPHGGRMTVDTGARRVTADYS